MGKRVKQNEASLPISGEIPSGRAVSRVKGKNAILYNYYASAYTVLVNYNVQGWRVKVIVLWSRLRSRFEEKPTAGPTANEHRGDPLPSIGSM